MNTVNPVNLKYDKYYMYCEMELTYDFSFGSMNKSKVANWIIIPFHILVFVN